MFSTVPTPSHTYDCNEMVSIPPRYPAVFHEARILVTCYGIGGVEGSRDE
jgi:hypothetical protein